MKKNKIYLLFFVAFLTGINGICRPQPGKKDLNFSVKNFNSLFRDTVIVINGVEVTSSIYFPPGYKKTKRNSLILVLDQRDSANLIIETIADSLDIFHEKGSPSAVVFVVKKISGGAGRNNLTDSAIITFVTNYLKPFIAKNFYSAGETSVIAGIGKTASLALQIKIRFPQYFNRAGLFIPELESLPVTDLIDSNSSDIKGMIFIHSINRDTSENGIKIKKCLDVLGKYSSALLYHFIESNRNEENLQASFLEFYKWILSDGNNYIINSRKNKKPD